MNDTNTPTNDTNDSAHPPDITTLKPENTNGKPRKRSKKSKKRSKSADPRVSEHHRSSRRLKDDSGRSRRRHRKRSSSNLRRSSSEKSHRELKSHSTPSRSSSSSRRTSSYQSFELTETKTTTTTTTTNVNTAELKGTAKIAEVKADTAPPAQPTQQLDNKSDDNVEQPERAATASPNRGENKSSKFGGKVTRRLQNVLKASHSSPSPTLPPSDDPNEQQQQQQQSTVKSDLHDYPYSENIMPPSPEELSSVTPTTADTTATATTVQAHNNNNNQNNKPSLGNVTRRLQNVLKAATSLAETCEFDTKGRRRRQLSPIRNAISNIGNNSNNNNRSIRKDVGPSRMQHEQSQMSLMHRKLLINQGLTDPRDPQNASAEPPVLLTLADFQIDLKDGDGGSGPKKPKRIQRRLSLGSNIREETEPLQQNDDDSDNQSKDDMEILETTKRRKRKKRRRKRRHRRDHKRDKQSDETDDNEHNEKTSGGSYHHHRHHNHHHASYASRQLNLEEDEDAYERYVRHQLELNHMRRDFDEDGVEEHEEANESEFPTAIGEALKGKMDQEGLGPAELEELQRKAQFEEKLAKQEQRKERRERKAIERTLRRAKRRELDGDYYRDSTTSVSDTTSGEEELTTNYAATNLLISKEEKVTGDGATGETETRPLQSILADQDRRKQVLASMTKHQKRQRILRKMKLIGILASRGAQLRIISAVHPNSDQNSREIVTSHSSSYHGRMTPVTAAFLRVLKGHQPTWGGLIEEMSSGSHSVAIPKLTSSHPFGYEHEVVFRPTRKGVRRAILLGPSKNSQMTKMKFFLRHQLEFPGENVDLYLDPKKEDIMAAFDKINSRIRSGDCIVLYYLAQPGVLRGRHSSDIEPDVIVPVDVETKGGRGLSDISILESLIKPMPKGVVVTFLLDTLLHSQSFKLQYNLEQRQDTEQAHAHGGVTMGGVVALSADVRRAANAFKTGLEQTSPSIGSPSGSSRFHHSKQTTAVNISRNYGTNALVRIIAVPDSTPSAYDTTGFATAQFLQIMNDHPDNRLTIDFVLLMMRAKVNEMDLSQVPQMTCSRRIPFREQLKLVPKETTGRKRILLIGIDYLDEHGLDIYRSADSLPDWEDSGAADSDEALNEDWKPVAAKKNVYAMKKFLKNSFGVTEKDCIILLDDGQHLEPSKENILDAFTEIVQLSRPGDSVFVYYQGFGTRDDEGRECLVPCDEVEEGFITGQEMYSRLIAPIHESVSLTCFMDMPLTGSLCELPYRFQADQEQMKMLIPATVFSIRTTQGGATKPFLSCMRNAISHDKWIPAMDEMAKFVSESDHPNRYCVLASSRVITDDTEIELVPFENPGKRRALLIGVNYTGIEGFELDHCHSDVEQFKQFLQLNHGFTSSEWKILLDRPKHTRPTRQNIERALYEVAQKVRAGDATFLYYSGHGSKILGEVFGSISRDGVGKKFEDALVPSDIDEKGTNIIPFNYILHNFVRRLPEESHLTIVLDCHKSNSVLSLPYKYRPNRLKPPVEERELSFGERFFGSKFVNQGFTGLWSDLGDEIDSSASVSSFRNLSVGFLNPPAETSEEEEESDDQFLEDEAWADFSGGPSDNLTGHHEHGSLVEESENKEGQDYRGRLVGEGSGES